MAKKIIQMKDKYKSTTNLYPKVTMGSLSPAVKEYIESQGEQEETKGNITAKIFIDKWGDYGVASVMQSKKDTTHLAECRVFGNKIGDNDVYGAQISYQEGTSLTTVAVNKDGIQLGTFDKDINIDVRGTGKLYINEVEYTGGGSLYQHNITCSDGTYSHCVRFEITNNDNTTYNTYSQIISLLNNKGYVLTATDITNNVIDKLKMATGKNGTGSGDSITGVGVQENVSDSLVFAKVGASLQVVDISLWTIKDNKEAL